MDYSYSIIRLSKSFGRQQIEPAYKLSNGTVLFPSERDSDGCYWGAVGMDGMYLCTGVRYCPIHNDRGQILGFRKAATPDGSSDKVKA